MTNSMTSHTMLQKITTKLFLLLTLLLIDIGGAKAQWTDSATGVTYTPISGTNGNSGEGWAQGCDGLTTTKHGGNGSGPWYLVLQASEPVQLVGYSITTANDNATYTGRNPHSWKVEGSNDGTTWTTIDEVTNDATLEDVNYTEFDFDCSTTELYTYFRFYITAKDGGNYMQYSEFHPYGIIEGTPSGGGETSETGSYVITNGTYYFGGNSTLRIDTFNPSTCIWTGSSPGTWQNTAGSYLRMDRYNYELTTTYNNRTTNLTLLNTESGTTGQKLYSPVSANRYYFLQYNNGWVKGGRQYSAATTESGTDIVFAVTKYTYSPQYVNPAISGASEIVTNGAYRYQMTVIPTYKAGYVDYVFYNGAHHNFASNGTTPISNEPTTENYSSYAWSLSGINSTYATIDPSTGIISYTNSVSSATNATVTLTYTFPSGNTLQATKQVTFQPMTNPTGITMSSSTQSVCESEFENGAAAIDMTYTLTPANAYHNITVTSSNSAVATGTIGSKGVLSVSAKSIGTATLTLTVKNTSGGTVATTTVDVTVQAATATPTFSFDNTTNTVTLTAATGTTIHYTTNGTNPTSASPTYTQPFVQNSAATIKAIAVSTTTCDSPIGTFQVVKLEKPYAEVSSDGTSVTFTSTDDGVTFYYNSYDIDHGATNPGTPTSSSSSWTTGSSAVTITTNYVLQVIAMKAPTSTTGYITSDVFIRRVNTTDMSGGDYVFMYDDGTNVHFMANASGIISDATTFNPSSCIWQGEVFANDSEEAHTLLGGALYFEPFIRYSNNNQYLQIFTGCQDYNSTGWESGKLRVTNSLDDANAVYYHPRTIDGRGELINMPHYNDQCYSQPLTFQLGYNTSSNQWSRNGAIGIAEYNNDFFTVIYPVEERGGGGFTLTTTCPDDGAGGVISLNKGESTTFTASTAGTYNPIYYRVGNEVKYFYYYPNTSTPMTTEPTGTTDIRITYELVNGQGYCEMTGNQVTLLYDPGVDRLVSVRITATPYINGVAQTDAAQEEYCYFNILTKPPFPAPIINNVAGTNQYEMTCTAANSSIEYRIGAETEWHTYTTPVTVVTPGTVITARSYRGRGTANYELSDPVTYTVGGATLLIPTVTIDENGVVTITKNENNTVAHFGDDYIGETWLYTLDGSEPDPDNVGGTNPTQVFNNVTLTNGQTISVIAVDVNNPAVFGYSAVAVAHYKVNSGIDANNSGVITLNDYEDHEWSYYQASADLPSGYPDELHSPYPRNVKITYYGYGENTLSTSAVAAPAANTFTTNTTQGDVKVGIGEPGHTFVYYKTLERDANGRYPYQLIPNPFYVRPDVRTYTGSKTVTFTLNDTGGDGWGASYLTVDFSNGDATRTIQFTESQASKTVSFSVNTGVTMTLTWNAGGGKNEECSFTVSGFDNSSSTYTSPTGPRSGPLTAIKVTGTETVTTYTGFYKWRIKSIGTGNIYTASTGGTALNQGAMLDAETTYYFDPSDNGTTNVHNVTSMTIELEALWAPADVGNNNHSYGSVERTFYITNGGSSNSLTAYGHPCTQSSFYPNGTTNGTTVATLGNRKTNRANYTASADTKIEYIILNNYNNDVINAAGNNLIYGRGVTASGTICATSFYGRNTDATNLDYTLRLESGSFQNFYLTGASRTYSGIVSAKCVLGSDYDRAKADNTKLSIAASEGNIYGGTTLTFSGSNNRNNLTFDWMVKSGTFHSGITGSAAGGTETIYLGSSQAQNGNLRYIGKRRITVEGGNLAGIAGAMNNVSTTYGVNDGGWAVMMRIKGGIMRTSLYGAAAFAQAVGDRVIICTGGTVNGWIAGGCNGTQTGSGGTVNGDTKIYVGGETQVVHTNTDPTIGTSKGGNVFGAGSGYNDQYAIGEVNNSNVVLADDAIVSRGVYGGGNYGYVGTGYSSNLFILGGTATQVFGGSNQRYGQTVNIYMDGGLVKSGLYGGSNISGNINNNVTIQINGGQIGEDANNTGNVHGGGLGNATRVLGSVNMTIGESVGATKYVTIYGDVYGGSAEGRTNGNTNQTNGAVTNVTLNAGKIHGSLYGGGLGTSAYQAHVYGPVQVTVNGGGVHATSNMGSGAVYGCNNVNGAPQSTVKVDIYGTDAPADGHNYALDAVYGGGNQASYTGSPQVTIHNCDNSIEYVYGGGNAADINGSTTVTVWGADSIGTVFGGGHGDKYSNPQYEANVTGDVTVNIHGGKIGQVFGGSNSKGTIGGDISVDIRRDQEAGAPERCKMYIGEVYGGGNEADSNAGSIHIGCTGDEADGEGIGDVYGGANKANVNGNITLDIEGGNIKRVFGGNNSSGDISGTITVDVDWDTSLACRTYYLGSVFGGGNLAAYTSPAGSYPLVNIKNGTVSGNVFGAGMGDEIDATKGIVTGNPVVNIIGGEVVGDVYGGGSYADVNGNTTINLVSGAAGNVYGGGLGSELAQAMVRGNTTVLLNGSNETGATNDCAVKGNIFGCNNINGSPTGHVLVHVYKTAGWTGHDVSAGKLDDTLPKTDQTYEVAAVYGGGNMAAYVPTSSSEFTEVIIDGCDLTSIEYVYGGGNAASTPATKVTVNGAYEIGWLFGGGNGKDNLPNGDPNPGANIGYKAYADDATDAEKAAAEYGTGIAEVNALGGTIHRVFGGSNTKGNVRQTTVSFLDEADASCPLKMDEIYGGGNEAYMDGSSQLKLGCLSAMKELYGGSKRADVGGDIDLTITSGHFDRVFGGNNLGGMIHGYIKVNIEETGCNPITIGELYGCGNAAAYTTPPGKDDPEVNVKSFTSIGRIFGGGLGATAIVTGNPVVNINEVVGVNAPAYPETTINYTDNGTSVTLPAHTSGEIGAIGTVFGGGNAAKVIGSTTVNIGTKVGENIVFNTPETASVANRTHPVKGVNIIGNIFGGGNQAEVTGNTNVNIGKKYTPAP